MRKLSLRIYKINSLINMRILIDKREFFCMVRTINDVKKIGKSKSSIFRFLLNFFVASNFVISICDIQLNITDNEKIFVRSKISL